MAGVLLFVLVAGAATLLVLGLAAGGLGVAGRERAQAKREAAARGWRYAGLGSFEGDVGGGAWRGGAQQESDGPRRWIAFEAGLPGAVGVRYALQGAVPQIDDAAWAAVLTPEVRGAWAAVAARPGGALQAHCATHFLHVERDHTAQPPQLADTLAVLALGEALARATLAAAQPPR